MGIEFMSTTENTENLEVQQEQPIDNETPDIVGQETNLEAQVNNETVLNAKPIENADVQPEVEGETDVQAQPEVELIPEIKINKSELLSA